LFSFNRTDGRDREGVPNHPPPARRKTGRPEASASALPSSRAVVRTRRWARLVLLNRRDTAGTRQRTVVPRRPRARLASFEDFRLEFERSRRYGHSFLLVRFACGLADEGRFERSDKVASAVRSLVRTVDLVWAEGRNVYLLLPECDREMGEATLERIHEPLADLSSDEQRIETTWAVFPDDGLTSGALLDALGGRRAVAGDAWAIPPRGGPTAVPEGEQQTSPSEMNPHVA